MLRRRMRGVVLGVAVLAAAALLVACGSDDDGGNGNGNGEGGSGDGLSVAVASYELVAGTDGRFIAGVLTPDNQFVSYGTVEMRFFYLGEERAEGEPELVQEATGTFLAVPGEAVADPPDRPQAGPASEGRGVYAVEPIRFDRPGIWQVEVTADLADGGKRTGRDAFQVLAEPRVPAPGDQALPTESYTVDSDAPPRAIDSRAGEQGEIPDPELHAVSIAQAIEEGQPALVVFATPVYCVSQFCGPVTDMVAELEREYGDRMAFIHVEIWHDYQEQAVNRAAADWLLREGNLQEPWFFLIGPDGTIVDRWDNLATKGEIVPALEEVLGA